MLSSDFENTEACLHSSVSSFSRWSGKCPLSGHSMFPMSSSTGVLWSALDHIKLTYHDVMVFAMPEFKSLEVLDKKIFALILLSINPKTNPNPDPNYKEKT